MELLEGTPLDRLLAAGPLPADRAIEIAIDVSAALSYAHDKGIVHRDIKPANLFIATGGTAKLTDFGIAQRIGDSGTARGGTPSYASPEQREGSGSDERSDIFSLGAVLYEMLTARPLFDTGGLPTHVAYAQDTPEELKVVVERCVAPNPTDRFRSAAELQSALEKLRLSQATVPKNRSRLAALVVLAVTVSAAAVWVYFPRASGPRFRSIAVLPFVNLSADPDQEYLADGMTEALTSDLAELGAFRVISRTSAMTFKGTREPVANIARRLSVDALLEGSVIRSGGRVRVVAQLIDPAKDTHFWSRTWERDFVDVLRLQSELAGAIVREIAVRPDANVRGQPPRQMKPDAYEAYLKGMFHLSKFTPEGFTLGVSYLEQATQKDPADPAAWAKLAMGYAIMGHERSPEEFARAKAAATKSLELGGPEAEAYAVLGMAELYSEWKFESGASNLQRAIQLNPSLAEARRAYSWYLLLSGRGQEALAEMRRAVELEPLVPIYPADLAWQYLDQRDCDAALKHALQALELNPVFGQALAVLGLAYQVKGMHAEAETAHRKAAADEVWRWPLARTLARSGRTVEARKMAADLARKPGPMHKWGLAIIHASLGDNDAALQFLEQAVQQRFTFLPWDHCPNSPAEGTDSDLFAALRRDLRFHDLGRRIGVPVQR